MASEAQVKRYIAYWFQLGKQVVLSHLDQKLLPKPIFEGDRYSLAFENCWQLLRSPDARDGYLEGTDVTVCELLEAEWEIVACARCDMPIPLRSRGIAGSVCPCHDLPFWPDDRLPRPKHPVNTQVSLRAICQRLVSRNSEES